MMLKIIEPTGDDWLNKNGLLSAFGTYDGKKVKVYEAFNKEQVKLRLFLEQQPSVMHFFPRVLHTENLLICEEYIEGESPELYDQESLANAVGQLVKNLRRINYGITTWDYMEHIHERVGMPFTPLLYSCHINHNDLTLDNIIMQDSKIKVIDNEFLACNNGWFMNMANSNILRDSSYNYGIDNQTIQDYWKVRRLWTS